MTQEKSRTYLALRLAVGGHVRKKVVTTLGLKRELPFWEVVEDNVELLVWPISVALIYRLRVSWFDRRWRREKEPKQQQAQGQPQPRPQIKQLQDDHAMNRELEQLKIVSEYVKFHIGLYLATPPVLVILAEGLQIGHSRLFLGSFSLMILCYLVSGISAGWFMGKYINHPWNDERLRAFSTEAYSLKRRILHHWLYWAGLVVGLLGLVGAYVLPSIAS